MVYFKICSLTPQSRRSGTGNAPAIGLQAGISNLKQTATRLKSVWPIFFLVVLTTCSGCSDDQPGTDLSAPLVSTHQDSDRTLRIVFRWPGDDFAARQKLDIRDRIERAIAKEGLGRIVRAGTGMGWMDIIVEVKDKNSARIEIEALIKKIYPEAEFTIQ